MKPIRRPWQLLIVYCLFVALCAFFALGNMLASQSEPGNAIMLGLSLPRLALASGLLFAFIFYAAILIKAAKDHEWAGRLLDGWFGRGQFRRVTVWLGGISFGLGWIGVFLPSHRVGELEDHWIRIQPVMVFILLTGIATLVLLYLQNRRSDFNERSISVLMRMSTVLLVICLLPMLDILYGGFEVHSSEDFWYGAGVPILVQQLIAAIAGGILFLQAEKKWDGKLFDPFVFVLVFAVTLFLWAREPLQQGFSFVAHPPNNVLYPIYDAAAFDIGSQFPLIGQKINIYGSYFFERPLYPAFLVFLHALLGQDYEILMAGQAAAFAILPALIYLIGRSLGFRSVGFAAALVAMFRGMNAIAASNMIDLAGPKMILTDFPAAIGVALVVLAVCEWLKMPGGKWQYALWVGGALGFTLMLRINALILLAPIVLFAFIRFFKDWKKWLYHSFLIILGIIAITIPWELRNLSLGGQMYGPIMTKVRAVIDQRYSAPPESVDPAPSIPITQSTWILHALYRADDPVQSDTGCGFAACFVPNHLLHNIVTSVLILPTSPVMDDLRSMVRENNQYWHPAWDGRFAFPALLIFLLNLFLIMTGISIAWTKAGMSGLAPLAVFLFHNLSNAFARTSGGRYIVPADWIIAIYYLIGVVYLIIWAAKTIDIHWEPESKIIGIEARQDKKIPGIWIKAFIVIIILAGFGSLLPLSENLYSEQYSGFNAVQAINDNRDKLELQGLNPSSIESFLQNANAEILVGRVLYPRYYRMDQGATSKYPNLPLPFPRLTFNLIGPNGQQNVLLPGDVPAYFPHAGDVIVIGCREQAHFDALAVLFLDETHTLYTRSPESELTCPLRQPVCNNNSVCR